MGEDQLPSRRSRALHQSGRAIKVPEARVRETVGIPKVSRVVDTGLEEIGTALSGLSERFRAAEDKSRRLAEGVQITDFSIENDRLLGEDFDKLSRTMDATTPEFLTSYDALIEQRKTKAMQDASGFSEESQARLERALSLSGAQFRFNANKFKIAQLDARVADQVVGIGNAAALEAERDPDSVGLTIAEVDDKLRAFAGHMDENTQRDNEDAILKKILRGAVIGFAKRGRFEEAEELLSPEKSGELISPAERKSLERVIAGVKTEAEKLLNEEKAVAASDLEIAVARGEASYPAVEAALNAKVISPAKRTQLVKDLDDQAEGQKKDAALAARVADALRGETNLDPRDKDDRKGVDALYKNRLAPALVNQPAEVAATATAEFVKATGIVPETVQSEIRGGLRSGDAGAKAKAADMLDRLRQTSPQALRDFTEKDITEGLHIATLVRSGVPSPEAVRIATEAAAVPEAERTARKTRAREEKHPDDNLKFLRSESARGFFESRAELPDALVGEFQKLQSLAFMRTGDYEASKQVAFEQVRNVWAISEVGGPARWLKYAPERYGLPTMSDEDNAEWMQSQLVADVHGIAPDVDEDNIRIFATPETAREQFPSYAMMIERDGVFEPLIAFEDGKPMRWRPDFPSHAKGLQAERKERGKKVVKDARKSRKARRVIEGAPAGFLGVRGGAF